MTDAAEDIIIIQNVCTRFGETIIHSDLNLTVKRGEILGIVGGSGSVKPRCYAPCWRSTGRILQCESVWS